MRRVSSRQRLVSWDAFDATVASTSSDDDDSEDDDFQTCHAGSSGSLLLLEQQDYTTSAIVGRKRERPRNPPKYRPRGGKSLSTPGTILRAYNTTTLYSPPPSLSSSSSPTLIPAYPWEVQITSSSSLYSKYNLDTLHQDVQLVIVSFLNVQEARSLSVIKKYYRRLLLSPEARHLWRAWLCRRWPALMSPLPNTTSSSRCTAVHLNNTTTTAARKLSFVDVTRTPTPDGQSFADGVNLSALVGMASKHQATRVDQDLLFKKTELSSPPRLGSRRQSTTTTTVEFSVTTDKTETIQFTGRVGSGDRCIRSDQPLPRAVFQGSMADEKASFLRKIICRGATSRSSSAEMGSLPPYKPFVAPFCTRVSDKELQINLSPRLVSYYEVSILEPSVNKDDDDDDEMDDMPSPLHPGTRRRRAAPDCVAVGLATRDFPLHGRMPGWTKLSFGYHGDDGGIFHGAGDMLRRYGPSFGRGDTVGCGVDYATRSIFYTLNGEFLGFAWTHLDKELMQLDWYPTVGVDTNCPVQCNFGERPFRYDLVGMIKRQEATVKECREASCRGTLRPEATTSRGFSRSFR